MRSSSPRKAEFLEKAEKGKELDGHEKALKSYAYGVYGYGFYNTSPLDFRMLTDDAENVAGNVRGYIAAFSPDVRDVMLRFNFDPIIDRLARADLLYQVVGRFADADLYPDTISNTDMGYLYEGAGPPVLGAVERDSRRALFTEFLARSVYDQIRER